MTHIQLPSPPRPLRPARPLPRPRLQPQPPPRRAPALDRMRQITGPSVMEKDQQETEMETAHAKRTFVDHSANVRPIAWVLEWSGDHTVQDGLDFLVHVRAIRTPVNASVKLVTLEKHAIHVTAGTK